MWDARQVWRFGEFQVDPVAYALQRRGRPVRLEHQPMDLLILLLERCGELVSRDDIISRLWPPDVFIDYDTGVSTARFSAVAAIHRNRCWKGVSLHCSRPNRGKRTFRSHSLSGVTHRDPKCGTWTRIPRGRPDRGIDRSVRPD